MDRGYECLNYEGFSNSLQMQNLMMILGEKNKPTLFKGNTKGKYTLYWNDLWKILKIIEI